jgi:hypothetical protein
VHIQQHHRRLMELRSCPKIANLCIHHIELALGEGWGGS